MGKYKFTIIIPHHNSPDLLMRCLDSIPNRSDLQTIVVDDNSSPEVVNFNSFEKYKKVNTQIILTNEGRGAGYARNVGLKCAEGDWLFFADADDTFNTDEFENVLTYYSDSNCDIIFLNANVINAETRALENERLSINLHMKSKHKKDIEWFRYQASYPWAKMIKRKLVESYGIQFEEVLSGNDAMFSLQIGYYANEVELVDISVYNWIFRSKGNITSNFSMDSALSKFGVAIRRNEFMEREGIPQFRQSLFQNHFFLLHKAGMSYYNAFKKVIHNTPNKYLLSDILSFIKFVLTYKR